MLHIKSSPVRLGPLLFFLIPAALIAFPAQAQNRTLGDFTYPKALQRFSQPAKFTVADKEFEVSAQVLNDWVRQEEVLGYDSRYLSEIENPDYCPQLESVLCSLTLTVSHSQHVRKISTISLETEPIKKFLEDLARQFDKDPENAKLQMEEGRVSLFTVSKQGLKINQAKSLLIILDALERDNYGNAATALAYENMEPEISLDSINDLGIEKLIGEGRSNFKGSPKNRIFNIKVATNRFHGVLIRPSEEFSFVSVLGEVDGEHGYLPELVIKKDKTEPEFGGGICQVSTTAFRAAINAGMEITARRNHAYPVQYYNPQGMDATVYVPRPDLRFINNTPGHILIQTKIEGTELVFQFYGTDDGRKVEIIGPKIIERNPDGSLKATFTQKVYTANNDLLIDDVFNSSYDSPNKYPHPGQVLTKKPEDWSDKQWKDYKKKNNI